MITSLSLSNFRAIDSLEVGPIRPITLIAGQNNTGKTTILEAINLACVAPGADLSSLPRTFRSQANKQPNSPQEFASYWSWVFPNGDFSKNAKIVIHQEGNELGTIELRPSGNGRSLNEVKVFFKGKQVSPEEVFGEAKDLAPLFTITHSAINSSTPPGLKWTMPHVGAITHGVDAVAIAELFNQVAMRKGGEEKIQGMLRMIDPRLQKLRYLKMPGTFDALVYCDLGLEEMLPSTLLGQGFCRVLEILCRVEASKLDVLLIDEIESGLHYSALRDFWRGLFQMATKANVQLIATTHSWECVRAALHVLDNLPAQNQELFQYLRLDRVDGSIQCTAPDRQTLEIAETQGWEMR